MKKQYIKQKLKEVFGIVFIWMVAISLVYLVYLKIKLLHHN